MVTVGGARASCSGMGTDMESNPEPFDQRSNTLTATMRRHNIILSQSNLCVYRRVFMCLHVHAQVGASLCACACVQGCVCVCVCMCIGCVFVFVHVYRGVYVCMRVKAGWVFSCINEQWLVPLLRCCLHQKVIHLSGSFLHLKPSDH